MISVTEIIVAAAISQLQKGILSTESCDYCSESQVDPWLRDGFDGRQSVQPMGLGRPFHHKQAPVFQQQRYRLCAFFMPE